MEARIEEIVCPKCKSKQGAPIWTQIDAQENSDAKQKLAEGTLFIHKCNTCQFQAPITYNSVYQDKQKHFAIYLSADRNQEGIDKAISEIKAADGECEALCRVVFNINSLREKMIILDNDLDDRIIEVMKLFYVSAIHEGNKKENVNECYFCIVDNQWRIEVIMQSGNTAVFEVKPDLYEEFKNTYSEVLAKTEPTYYVNAELAYRIYQAENK